MSRRPKAIWLTGTLPLLGMCYACLFEDTFWIIFESACIRWSGYGCLVFLVLCLAIRPLEIMLHRGRQPSAPAGALRRPLGILSAFWALAHVVIILFFHGEVMIYRVLHRTWLLEGLVAFLILLTLWFSSYPYVVKLLRIKVWKSLHRLAHAGLILGALHVFSAPRLPSAALPWLGYGIMAIYSLRLAHFLAAQRPGARSPSNLSVPKKEWGEDVQPIRTDILVKVERPVERTHQPMTDRNKDRA